MSRKNYRFHLGEVLTVLTGRNLSLHAPERARALWQVLGTMVTPEVPAEVERHVNVFCRDLRLPRAETKLVKAYPSLASKRLVADAAQLSVRLGGVCMSKTREIILGRGLAEIAKKYELPRSFNFNDQR